MLNISTLQYKVKEDLDLYLQQSDEKIEELAKNIGISRKSLELLLQGKEVSREILDPIYSFLYKSGYRLNKAKEELLKETREGKVLFHGSKLGLEEIGIEKGRNQTDFGRGFYLGESFNQALEFVFEFEESSIYSFELDTKDLRILEFKASIEWMLAICYFRHRLDTAYKDCPKVQEVIKKTKDIDIIIAPMIDNRMYHIMNMFADGEINADVALHTLSVSNLGNQYILKTEKALKKLIPLEKHYLSKQERTIAKQLQDLRKSKIDTKYKLALRAFKTGPYIEEVLQ